MSASEDEPVRAPSPFEHFEPVHPALLLEGAWDDQIHPREYTIHTPRGGLDIATRWITIDAEHAVRLTEVR